MLGLANHRGATRGQQAAAADLALAAGLAGLGGQGMVPIMLYNTRKEKKASCFLKKLSCPGRW
jgi:hypothetical protein